jgi:glycoprotein-N-acetylgalactosamine 3-beta-galactosyltransferase
MKRLGAAMKFNRSLLANFDTFADDLEISLVLKKIGVPSVGNTDKNGRQLFLTLGVDFERLLTKRSEPGHWLWRFGPGSREGRQCCSTRWISSHYTSPYEMYALDDMHAQQCEGVGDEPYS